MKPNTMTQLRVATYARYSSDQQRASSITDQRRNCAKRAKAEGWKVVAEFADQAISGNDDRRPQYLAMQDAALRGEFDVLLIDDLSRLTRDSMEQEKTMRRLEFRGVRIVTVSDGYDSLSKGRKLHRQAKGMMNELFNDDLAEKVHRGQEGQARLKRWCGGRPYGYRLKPVLDPSNLDAYGQPARIATLLEVEPVQAKVVAEIFKRYGKGESCLTIARDLNKRGVASPGSSWKRVSRTKNGWQTSSVRVVVRNPLYTGLQRWNVSRFVQDPDTKKYLRRARPEAEWVTNQIESLRIVSDDLFQAAQQRSRVVKNDDVRLKSGGRAKYLLSGLMSCASCGRNYVLADNRQYACGGYAYGRTCKNSERAYRTTELEDKIVRPVLAELRDPVRVAKMAREMEAEFARRIKAAETRATASPRELLDLDARLARLRARLQAGDPDMTADEIQAGIDRAEAKRRAIVAEQPAAKQRAKVLAMLPKAAAMYLKQLEDGLAGDPRAVLRARHILRDYLGPITLTPGKKGELWASYRLNAEALIKSAGTAGRGDRI